jgi:hypothetical protein
MRLNFSTFLLLMLEGCSGAGLDEQRMPPPSPEWGREDTLREQAETEGGRDLPPVALIVSPPKGARYREGGTITFEGRGSDLEDGGLLASAFTWQVDFHAGDRVIPFVPPISGMGRGTFTVPAREETEGPGWYRVRLKLTDSRGNTHEVFRDVYPQEPEPELRRSALVR